MKSIILLLFLIAINFIIIGYFKEYYSNKQKIVYKYLPGNSLDKYYENNSEILASYFKEDQLLASSRPI